MVFAGGFVGPDMADPGRLYPNVRVEMGSRVGAEIGVSRPQPRRETEDRGQRTASA